VKTFRMIRQATAIHEKLKHRLVLAFRERLWLKSRGIDHCRAIARLRKAPSWVNCEGHPELRGLSFLRCDIFTHENLLMTMSSPITSCSIGIEMSGCVFLGRAFPLRNRV
jgi:hypothetical protein